MRSPLLVALLSVLPLLLPTPGCSLFAKSPALQDPLHERLAKADLTSVEDATKSCLSREGWKPNDLGAYSEGATVVSARNAAKDQMSVYIQSSEVSPRVTGGPAYDDPFWGCLGHELEGGKTAPAAEAASGDGR
jgi:hypothetical protein